MRATQEQIDASSYKPDGEILRVSKSSYMTYSMCPRQFYWRYVADVPSPPPSEAAIRGTIVHSAMEHGILGEPEDMERYLIAEGMEEDRGAKNLASLIHSIASDLGSFDVVEAEVKHQVYEEFTTQSGMTPIIWVGMIDGVLRHPQGGLIVVELKTGKMNMGKLGRTRKEMVFYTRMLKKMGYDEVTHFLYLTPDYEVVEGDKLLNEYKKRGKTMWLGENGGYALLEPVTTRSINAFEQGLYDTIDSLKLQDFHMNWNEYFCPVWCDFHLNCESELTGSIEEWI
ncbi:MAG: hypothetical protein GOVbin1511_34 [Prokaryotic dsDNA virus sp.]|nr:MAG: hypothetical protein GOVbin1511_34 [Prokaryotic dsDNA virus sp.]